MTSYIVNFGTQIYIVFEIYTVQPGLYTKKNPATTYCVSFKFFSCNELFLLLDLANMTRSSVLSYLTGFKCEKKNGIKLDVNVGVDGIFTDQTGTARQLESHSLSSIQLPTILGDCSHNDSLPKLESIVYENEIFRIRTC